MWWHTHKLLLHCRCPVQSLFVGIFPVKFNPKPNCWIAIFDSRNWSSWQPFICWTNFRGFRVFSPLNQSVETSAWSCSPMSPMFGPMIQGFFYELFHCGKPNHKPPFFLLVQQCSIKLMVLISNKNLLGSGSKAIAYSMGHHSGGHLNPAVTFSPPGSTMLWTVEQCDWRCFCCLWITIRTVLALNTYTWLIPSFK